jgi:hypothetical protein
MAGGTSPRCWDVGVRIPPRAQVQGSGTDPASDGGVKDNARRSPSRPPIAVDVAQFGRARRRHRRGRRFDPGHPLHALVAQLADAHGPDPWLSSMRVRIPPSARNDKENEPARVPGLAANECAPHGAGFDCPVLLARKCKPTGDGNCPENSRAARAALWVQLPPFPLATTQPVDGACLMNRYCAVRLRGGQLAGSQAGEGACLISRRYAGSSPARPAPPAPDRTGTGLLIRTAGVRVLWAARRTPRPHRLWVKIPDLHSGEQGSTPCGATAR